MTIRQALKQKNKLVKEISDKTKQLHVYNSVELGNNRPYSTKKITEELEVLISDLITLKTKIHKANEPVYHLIFEMSEWKSYIKILNNMDCTEGKSTGDRFRYDSESVKTSEISVRERDEYVKSYEDRIESIQDELDTFNATTEI